jgi:hypothetical protein
MVYLWSISDLTALDYRINFEILEILVRPEVDNTRTSEDKIVSEELERVGNEWTEIAK